jgi:hypothetical protein
MSRESMCDAGPHSIATEAADPQQPIATAIVVHASASRPGVTPVIQKERGPCMMR